MKGWIIFHSVLIVLGFFLMILYIIESNIFFASINAFTFIANAIMLVVELRNDVNVATSEGDEK